MDFIILLLDISAILAVFAAGCADAVLKCYSCNEEFAFSTGLWDPYTDCQINATQVSEQTCLDTAMFCSVTRTTVKGITVAMNRDCQEECFYGCTQTGWGVTRLECTTCCNTSLCNKQNSAVLQAFFLKDASPHWWIVWPINQSYVARLLLWTTLTIWCSNLNSLVST